MAGSKPIESSTSSMVVRRLGFLAIIPLVRLVTPPNHNKRLNQALIKFGHSPVGFPGDDLGDDFPEAVVKYYPIDILLWSEKR